jgi:hypothetical protein
MADAAMNSRRNLSLLFGLFAILAILVILTSQEPETAGMPQPTAAETAESLPEGTLLRVFPDLTVLDIQAIRLEDLNAGQELTLARDTNGRWTAPDLEGELDTEAASNVARTLVLLPYARSINIVPDTQFEDYGLAPRPQLLFQILEVDGASHAIAVGNLSDAGHSYYSVVDERDEIYQLERGAVDFLKNLISTMPIRLTN